MTERSNSTLEMPGAWTKYNGEELMRGDIVKASIYAPSMNYVCHLLLPHRNGIWWAWKDFNRTSCEVQVDKGCIAEVYKDRDYFIRHGMSLHTVSALTADYIRSAKD